MNKNILKDIFEYGRFIFLGLFLCFFAFYTVADVTYWGFPFPKQFLMVASGLFLLILACVTYYNNQYKKVIQIENFLYGILLFDALIEGIQVIYEEKFIEAIFVFLLPLILVLINLFYSFANKKDKIKPIDQYVNLFINIVCLAIIFTYLIYRSNPINFDGANYGLSTVGLIFLILFGFSWTGNTVLVCITKMKWNYAKFKELIMLILIALLGGVMILHSLYYCILRDGTFQIDFNADKMNTPIIIFDLIFGSLTILASFILYFVFRKKDNINKLDLFALIITLSNITVFAASGFKTLNDFFFYLLWFLSILGPVVILIIKYVFKKVVIDLPPWVNFCSVACCAGFLIGYSSMIMAVNTVYHDRIYSYYVAALTITSLAIIFSAIYLICSLRDLVKDDF